jgi:2-methylcitrate dehydratase PrpD
MDQTLSRRMAGFAFGEQEFPPEVVECAKEHILDALGVGIAGASLPGSDRLHAAVLGLGAAEEASVLGFPGRLPAPSAALLNGTFVHSLEYDDTHTASIVHGSSVIVAAALAAAEKHNASGADFVRAVVIGWEIMIRMGLAAPGAFQRRGFQVTSVGGPFIAALLATLLARRPADEAVHAMGIAGSQAGGVFEFLSEGATVKSMHPGWAAHAGLAAAQLAAGGMTGPSTIFEGTHGFYRVYAGDADAPARLAESLDTLGARWLILDASLKGHPCCHYIHPFLECAERLRASAIGVERIGSIECDVPEEQAMLICDPWERKLAPASGYDAKFSLPYVLAMLLCEGRVGVDTFAGPANHRGALELAKRISWKAWKGSGFPQRFAAKLRVKLKDGRSIEESVSQVRGSPERPFSRSEIVEKFDANAALRLGEEGARVLRQSVLGLPDTATRDLLRTARVSLEAA